MRPTKKAASRFTLSRPVAKTLLLSALSGPYWFCADCEKVTEREEGEQGQPAHCQRCGSHRIQFQPAVFQKPYEEKVFADSDRARTRHAFRA
jgi:DNA-directed RNA polymerase subunit RPC12/RpoP